MSRILLICSGLILVCGALAVLAGIGSLPVSPNTRRWLIDSYFSTEGVLEWQAQEAGSYSDPKARAKVIEVDEALVRRDPANPYRWCDLAEAFQAAEKLPEARQAFVRAVSRGPAIPPVLVRAGNFYFSTGDPEMAAKSYRDVLALTHEYDPIIFLTLRRMGFRAADVTARVLPKNVESGRNYLEAVIQAGDVSEADAVWAWLSRQGLGSDKLASRYVDFLLQKGRGAAAAAAWAAYLGARRGDFLGPNLVYNGRFASDPSGSRMDWHIEPLEGVEAELVPDQSESNGRALEIRFAGEANVAFHHVWQTLWVAPGTYSVRARVKSDRLTTNQGVQLHLTDPVRHQFDWFSEPVTGTREWFWLEGKITVPNCPFLLLEIVRQPSEKFDNKIHGTVQLENVSVTRVDLRPS